MKNFKNSKRWVKFKRTTMNIIFTILPYIPALSLLFGINILLGTKFYDETLRVLAAIGLIFVSWYVWKFTNKLCEVVDSKVIAKRESNKVEGDLEVE